MPEDGTRRLFLEVIQVHLAAKLAVIALFGLLQHGEISLEIFLIGPSGRIDPLQHRII